MGVFAAGQVVVLPFPFSDLSRGKLRPVLLIAAVGHQDWVVCQITSNPYADIGAIELRPRDFLEGSLERISYVRPGKLFTANESLFQASVGVLIPASFSRVRDAVVDIIRGMPGRE